MKVVFTAMLIASMVLTSSFLQATMAYHPAPPTASPSVCDKKCSVRCEKAGYKDRCMKYCGLCCEKCKQCVPCGTYGNKSDCPCYRDMLNSKGHPKCP